MIAKALTFVRDMLNQELKISFGMHDDKVVVSSLINPDGSIAPHAENRIVLSVINLEHETTVKSMQTFTVKAGNDYVKKAPPVYLNMYLLIAANYDSSNYLEANKMLSRVISVFQAHTHFNRDSNPTMQSPLQRLTFEIYNLPIDELSHIWSGIGAKYVPSIIYKVRMLTLQEDLIKEEIPSITGLDGSTTRKG